MAAYRRPSWRTGPMMHLFINALAASAGGGLTYIRNVVPQISRRGDVRATVLVNPALKEELGNFGNVEYVEPKRVPRGPLRYLHEQARLPGIIRRSGAHVLLSAGNVALRRSPIPQILLSRNSLYTSTDFYRDLAARGDYRIWIDTRLKAAAAKRSIYWADCTVAPSRAFARELERWTRCPVRHISHGFDRESFFGGGEPAAPGVQQMLHNGGDALKLLFVSHYNYYRNFETLLRAIPIIRQQLAPRPLKLFLTCRLSFGENPGSYRPEAAAALIDRLGIRESVVELGAIPYAQLHHVYRACHLYVTPAYTETFAHPLIEAMACGLPVIASDLPVHREICQEASLYFPPFSEQALAESVVRIANNRELAGQFSQSALSRADKFSWERHTAEILALAEDLISRENLSAA